jgi:ferritin
MTKQEVKAKLRELAESGDTEAAHSQADDAIMDFLKWLGHEDVVELFDKIDKWYA